MPFLNRGKNAGAGPAFVYWSSPTAPDPTGAFYPAPPPSGVPFGQLEDVIATFMPAGMMEVAAEAKRGVLVAAGSVAFASGGTVLTLSAAAMGARVPGGRIDGVGVVGAAAAAFPDAVTESGQAAGQAGLGASAQAGWPYPTASYPGQRGAHSGFTKPDGDDLLLRDVITVPPAGEEHAPVYGYASYREDLVASSQQWRIWPYYTNEAGLEVPVQATQVLAGVLVRVLEVYPSGAAPVWTGSGGDGAGAGQRAPEAPLATDVLPGLMAPADKGKLDAIGGTFVGEGTTVGGAPVVLQTVNLTDNATTEFAVTVVGARNDGGAAAGYDMRAAFRRVGAAVTALGDLHFVDVRRDDPNWGLAALTPAGTAVEVYSGAAAGQTIKWSTRGVAVAVAL